MILGDQILGETGDTVLFRGEGSAVQAAAAAGVTPTDAAGNPIQLQEGKKYWVEADTSDGHPDSDAFDLAGLEPDQIWVFGSLKTDDQFTRGAERSC